MNILFATDGSADASHAANFLSTLRCKEPISLTVLTTTYAPERADSPSSQAWFPEWRKMEVERVESHHATIRGTLERLDKDLRFIRIEGHASHEILKSAKECDADLIVLGARGHSAIGRMLLGSVSDSVATHAECSVLVVRPEPGDQTENSKCQITLGYDGSDSSKAAVDELNRFQWSDDCIINVLSVVPQPGFVMSEYPVLIQEHNEAAVKEARLETEKLAGLLAGNIKQPTSQVAIGNHIGETIIAKTAEAGSNLIVLGDTGRGFLGTLMLGSISRYVLRHASSSVWISRHHTQAND